jgi:hypothetical protein
VDERLKELQVAGPALVKALQQLIGSKGVRRKRTEDV